MGIIREQTLGILQSPPKFGCGLAVTGNVPNLQRFDAVSGIYEPDYTLTPLTIEPVVAAIDSDSPLSSADARKLLANIHWFEIADDGSATEIVLPADGYVKLVNTEGAADAGLLQRNKNATPSQPIRLQFRASLVTDADTFSICENINIRCRDTTAAVSCKFDSPDVVVYNPLHDPADLKIVLHVWENGRKAAAANYIPQWEVRRDDGTWCVYGSDITDYWLDIAADSTSAVLHRDLMGDGASFRVRLRYDSYGNPAAVVLPVNSLGMPSCSVECIRDFGNYSHRLLNTTNIVADWSDVLHLRVVFKDNTGDIDDALADSFFRVTMYAGGGGKALTAADKVGIGREQDIPTSPRNAAGLKIGYELEEIGPLKAWADADGTVFTDADGAILLIK